MALAEVKPIELALQGGGAHGAFTCGLLDRLLEDRRLQIEGIGGTSAGAMNAVSKSPSFGPTYRRVAVGHAPLGNVIPTRRPPPSRFRAVMVPPCKRMPRSAIARPMPPLPV